MPVETQTILREGMVQTGASDLLSYLLAGDVPLMVVLAIHYELFCGLAGPAISAATADLTPRDRLVQVYSLPYWANHIADQPLARSSWACWLRSCITCFFWAMRVPPSFGFGVLIWCGVSEPGLPHQTKREKSAEHPKYRALS